MPSRKAKGNSRQRAGAAAKGGVVKAGVPKFHVMITHFEVRAPVMPPVRWWVGTRVSSDEVPYQLLERVVRQQQQQRVREP